MYLEIVTPDKKVFAGSVESATFPGADGSFQVLANHAPIISALGNGELKYKGSEAKGTLNIEGGVVEVLNNRITVLVERIIEA